MPHSDGRHLACPADSDNLPLAPFSVKPKQWGDFMKRELLARRAPANIMGALRNIRK